MLGVSSVKPTEEYLVLKGEDSAELIKLRGQLRVLIDKVREINDENRKSTGLSFDNWKEIKLEDLLKLEYKEDPVKKFKRENPVADIVAKVLFGPRKYESIPHIKDIPKDEYTFVRQESSFSKTGKKIFYVDLNGHEEGARLIHFKSAKHPIVKTEEHILVQFSVYKKDATSDKLDYIFCETLVLEKREEEWYWQATGRRDEPDFTAHYGTFDHYAAHYVLCKDYRVDNLRRLIHDGELRGEDSGWMSDDIVLRLGFEDPDLKF